MANEVRVIVKAVDNASGEIDKARKSAENFNKAINLASAAVTGGLIAGFGAAVKTAADFEHGLSQVGAIANASAKDMEGLRSTALRIGKDTAFSASEATKAMEELAAGGVSAKDIMDGAADAAVNLAAAGGTDLATAANVAASALNVWGMSTKDLSRVVNDVAGAANVSKFGVEDMSLAIAQGGGVAAAAGVSFDDFAASIAATSSSFSSGSDAGTSFKTFLTSLANPADKAKTAMEQIGFSAYDASGNLKSMKDIVQNLHDALGPLSEQQRAQAAATIFGTDAMRTGLGLAKMTGEEFQKLSDTMKNTNAADVAAQRMNNLSGDIEQLKGSLETVAIQIGSAAIPALSGLAGVATKATNAFGSLPQSTQTMLLGVTTLTAAMPAMVSGVEKGVSAVKSLGTAASSTKAEMTLAAGALGLYAIAADGVLQALTGHGLIDSIKIAFGSDSASSIRLAAKETAAFKQAMIDAGTAADPIAVLMGRLQAANNDYAKSLEPIPISINRQSFEYAQLKNLGGEARDRVEALSKVMKENGATSGDLIKAYESLNPAIRDSFMSATEAEKAYQAQGDAIDKARVKILDAEKAHRDLAVAVPTSKSTIDEFTASIQAAEKPTDALKAAIDALTATFSTMNPEAETLRATNAILAEELDDINAKTTPLTAAEQARVKVIEDTIAKNEKLIAGYDSNQHAVEGLSNRMKYLLGAEGYGGLLTAMNNVSVPQEKQIDVLGRISSAMDHASSHDIPGMLAGLEALKTQLKDQPELWAEVMQALGPKLQQAIKEAGPDAVAAAKGVGQDIIEGVQAGLDYYSRFLFAQAREMARRTVDEMHSGIQAGSPSKLSRDEVGIPIGEGVALGMVTVAPLIKDTAIFVAQDAVDAANEIVIGGMAKTIGAAAALASAVPGGSGGSTPDMASMGAAVASTGGGITRGNQWGSGADLQSAIGRAGAPDWAADASRGYGGAATNATQIVNFYGNVNGPGEVVNSIRALGLAT